jgi:hypothetical protein
VGANMPSGLLLNNHAHCIVEIGVGEAAEIGRRREVIALAPTKKPIRLIG